MAVPRVMHPLKIRFHTLAVYPTRRAPPPPPSRCSSKQAAVFTWYGCTIETTGWVSSIYVAKETPMKAYVNTHAQLEARRDKAVQELTAGHTNVTGPRVR